MVQAVYIHIPFCTHICHYCDFNKVFLKGQPVELYLEALDKEMQTTLEKIPAKELSTIFIGGGTPTALSETQLQLLMKSIHNNFQITPNIEFSIEANPGDLTMEKLEILKEYGVNRLSLGVQTFNNQLLEAIGRSHRADDVYATIENAKKCGFTNISVDLMYGLPGQTIQDVEHSLKEVFALDIQHSSAYSLIVEPKTVFYNLMNKGKLSLPGEDTEAMMYELVMSEMEKHGFNQYEISNYALPGYESRHNLVYWNNDPYYGFGAGAHGYLQSSRQANIGPVNKYIQTVQAGNLPIREQISVSKKEQMEEEMFLGLRKTNGVSISVFIEKFSENPLEKYAQQIEELTNKQLLMVSNGSIQLTKKGRMLGNEVFQQFLG
ncbi:radical SAM family heme chaperone HemW [Caldibacillus lycopersici]|uniref:Heme chaperone HemW n=1 Tax=Perspicuibacillus lycopersici TaxID=1325689 RepID=A0AAE3IXQ5_9BACI|nr:radical SAM family heme chaperone HemW [Perspicuibacillus lycopersici]MCU9613935.1 radical SAM family heme chaperone HemW [Perspicuibacillus lycopersici]